MREGHDNLELGAVTDISCEIFLSSEFLSQFRKTKEELWGGGGLHIGQSRILNMERKKKGWIPEQQMVKRKLGLIEKLMVFGTKKCRGPLRGTLSLVVFQWLESLGCNGQWDG